MKLIIAVIQTSDEVETVQELNSHGFFVTRLSTTGGFLKARNTTLLIGTEDGKVEELLGILKQSAGHRMQLTTVTSGEMRMIHHTGSRMIEVPTGGCVVFILDAEKIEKF